MRIKQSQTAHFQGYLVWITWTTPQGRQAWIGEGHGMGEQPIQSKGTIDISVRY